MCSMVVRLAEHMVGDSEDWEQCLVQVLNTCLRFPLCQATTRDRVFLDETQDIISCSFDED
jgi:hypothetical protein